MSDELDLLSRQLGRFSDWLDDNHPEPDNDSAVTAMRLLKVAEEYGEMVEAYIGWTGQNPRKGVTHTRQDVVCEALDVAITALGVVAHLTGSHDALLRLRERMLVVFDRVGIE